MAEVRRRLDEVEVDVAHLRKMLEKMRGRATGGIRHTEPDTAPPSDPRIPPNLDPVSERIWKRRVSQRESA